MDWTMSSKIWTGLIWTMERWIMDWTNMDRSDMDYGVMDNGLEIWTGPILFQNPLSFSQIDWTVAH